MKCSCGIKKTKVQNVVIGAVKIVAKIIYLSSCLIAQKMTDACILAPSSSTTSSSTPTSAQVSSAPHVAPKSVSLLAKCLARLRDYGIDVGDWMTTMDLVGDDFAQSNVNYPLEILRPNCFDFPTLRYGNCGCSKQRAYITVKVCEPDAVAPWVEIKFVERETNKGKTEDVVVKTFTDPLIFLENRMKKSDLPTSPSDKGEEES